MLEFDFERSGNLQKTKMRFCLFLSAGVSFVLQVNKPFVTYITVLQSTNISYFDKMSRLNKTMQN